MYWLRARVIMYRLHFTFSSFSVSFFSLLLGLVIIFKPMSMDNTLGRRLKLPFMEGSERPPFKREFIFSTEEKVREMSLFSAGP